MNTTSASSIEVFLEEYMARYFNCQLNNHFRNAGRWLLCCTTVIWALGCLAFQGSGTVGDSTVKTTEKVASPTYIEQATSKDALNKTTQQPGWQVGGLNTKFSSNIGDGLLSMNGGVYFSHAANARQAVSVGTPFSTVLNQSSLVSDATRQSLGFAGNLLSQNTLTSGKTNELFIQHMDFQRNGLSINGSYATVGKEFQGLADLTKQMDVADAKLLGLGMTNSNIAMKFTGVKNVEIASNRSVTVNNQAGNKEIGLTRTNQTNSVGLALSQKMHFDFSTSNQLESWDPSIAKKDSKEVQSQVMRLMSNLGQKSQLSLGQSLTNTLVNGKVTQDSSQQDISLKWNEWKNFSLVSGYSTKKDGLTNDKNNIINMEVSAAISPKLQFTGKLIDNTTLKANGKQSIANDQLELKISSALAKNLQFSTVQKNMNTPDKGEITTREQQLTWAPNANWQSVMHLLTIQSEKVGNTQLLEETLTGRIGSKTKPGQLSFYTRNEVMANDVQQNRHEFVYSRALTSDKNPARLLVHTGLYALRGKNVTADSSLVALQVLNLQPSKQSTINVGYYSGPKLGTGSLNYRTWGQRANGNLGNWSAQDFTGYHEFGGEMTHQFSASTRVVGRFVRGAIENGGAQALTEYAVTQQIGKGVFEGSHMTTETPGANHTAVNNNLFLWKLALPGKTALPAWAVDSVSLNLFEDGNTWGFTNTPVWMNKPSNGIALAKLQGSVNGKPVDTYTAQAAGMLSKQVYLQASYDFNPVKVSNRAQNDAVVRSMLHLAYAVSPTEQLFARYLQERAVDSSASLQTLALGYSAKLSPRARLQAQVDISSQYANKQSKSGACYMLEYEHLLQANGGLVLKLLWKPEEFSTAKDRIRLEASYSHQF